MWNVPTVAEYVRAITVLEKQVTDEHRTLFWNHYHAPARSATAKQLATWSGISGGHPVVNQRYGRLGHQVCDVLGIKPELRPDDTHRWWAVWSQGWSTPGGFVWQMLPNVAEALEQLGWASPNGFVLSDELIPTALLVEGAVCRVTVNAYERNSVARRQCIEVHGTNCCICGFNFGAVYGAQAEGYIHVHHLRPLSELGEAYVVNPVADLRPVCPNCHAVLHLGGGCRSIEEVRQLLKLQPA